MLNNSKNPNHYLNERYSFQSVGNESQNSISGVKESQERTIDSKLLLDNERNINYSNYSIISNDNDRSMNIQLNLEEAASTPDRDISYLSSMRRSERTVDLSNPALKIMNHSKFSSDILKHLNSARCHPNSWANKLEQILKENVDFDEHGCILYINNSPVRLTEGVKAFKEAIRFLKRQKPLSSFKTKEGLRRSAEDLVDIININDGKDDVISAKLAEVNSRMNKYGVAVGELKEIIEYGTFDPEFVVVSLILCDGDSSRKEREILFAETSNFASVYSGLLPSDIIFTVVNLAEQYFEKGAIIPEFIVEKYQINPRVIGKINVTDMNAFKSGDNTKTFKNNQSISKVNTMKSTNDYKPYYNHYSGNIEAEYREDRITNRGEYVINDKIYHNESSVFPYFPNDDCENERQYAINDESRSKQQNKEKYLRPLETIKGSSYSGTQSKYVMFSRPFKNSLNYEVTSHLPNNQRVLNTQNYTKTINIKGNEVHKQSSEINLNLNKNEAGLISNESNSKGKLVNLDFVDAVMKNRSNMYSTKSEANPVIKYPNENLKANNLNNYNGIRSIPIKSGKNEVIRSSNLGRAYQKENVYYTDVDITEQSNTFKNTFLLGTRNINTSEEHKNNEEVLHTEYSYNKNNFDSFKMTQHFPEKNPPKENQAYPIFSENEKCNSVNNPIITQEIRLNKESGNLDASYNVHNANFPDNVKSIRILEKDINFNNKNIDLNYDDNLNPNNMQNEEPYVKKKIIKKLIEFKDGSSEVIYYEK